MTASLIGRVKRIGIGVASTFRHAACARRRGDRIARQLRCDCSQPVMALLYALYFESSIPGIHGANAPRSIGQTPTLGCFRLINDDVVDLEKRVAIGTGVVL
jgi:lipoprotein-anchoring transpeptidase ErfK/SrfK